jgi:hypothetical protein
MRAVKVRESALSSQDEMQSIPRARDATFNRAATAPGWGLERHAGPRASLDAPLNVAG